MCIGHTLCMQSPGTRPTSAKRAQEIAYAWLKRRVEGTPRTQAVFLTEVEVSAEIGVSRTPVREALLRLQAEHLIDIIPGKGAFIPPITDEQVRSVMEARYLVETWSVQVCAADGAELAARLTENIDRQRTLLQDPVEFIECDREFHRAVVEAAGNSVLAEFYESLRDRQLRMGVVAIVTSQDRAATVLDEHTAITEAIAHGGAAAARRAVADHLRTTLGVLLPGQTQAWTAIDLDHHESGGQPVA
jgi:DNA-binding GntR family transcriptional regulator